MCECVWLIYFWVTSLVMIFASPSSVRESERERELLMRVRVKLHLGRRRFASNVKLEVAESPYTFLRS